jgi:hypothetical protein
MTVSSVCALVPCKMWLVKWEHAEPPGLLPCARASPYSQSSVNTVDTVLIRARCPGEEIRRSITLTSIQFDLGLNWDPFIMVDNSTLVVIYMFSACLVLLIVRAWTRQYRDQVFRRDDYEHTCGLVSLNLSDGCREIILTSDRQKESSTNAPIGKPATYSDMNASMRTTTIEAVAKNHTGEDNEKGIMVTKTTVVEFGT